MNSEQPKVVVLEPKVVGGGTSVNKEY